MIVVCGEALIDIVPTGDGVLRPTVGGGPFTTTRALARLGVPTSFLGRLSDDAFGQLLTRSLAEEGTDLGLASFGAEPTTLALAEVDPEGLATYRFYVDGTSAPNLTEAMLPRPLGAEVTALHLGTLGLVLEPLATTLLDLAGRESGHRLLMVDPNIRPGAVGDPDAYRSRLASLMAMSTIVKASDADLAWLFPGDDVDAATSRILAGGARVVVATLGARGAVGATARTRVRVAAPTVEVVDTIGAGDAFGAGLLTWLHENGGLRPDLDLDPDQLTAALELACEVASLTCTRPGADPPRRDQVRGLAGS